MSPGTVHAVVGEHAAQDAGELAYVPTGHVAAVYAQEEAPAGLKEPTGHRAQVALEAAPVAFDQVPAGHIVHATAPEKALYVPAGHGKGGALSLLQ